METLRLETKGSPHVIIKLIEGDLRLVGQSGQVFEAQAPSKGQLTVRQEGEQIELSCRAGCLVFLPSEAVVEAEAVAGEVHLGRIGGDLSVDTLTGALQIDAVGGDADVRDVQGDLQVGIMGGNLRLRQVDGAVEVEVGGDASVRLAP